MNDASFYTEEEIEKIRKRDFERFSKAWEIKRAHLKKGDWYEYQCGGMYWSSYSEDNFDILKALETLHAQSKVHNLQFLFQALEIVLSEADSHIGMDFWWIYEGFYSALKSKANTSRQKFQIAIFINKLVEFGSPKKPAFDAYAIWQNCSDTTPRIAFHEFQKNNKTYAKYLKSPFWRYDVKRVIEDAKKPFPNTHNDVFNAYNRMIESIKTDETQKEQALNLAYKRLSQSISAKKK